MEKYVFRCVVSATDDASTTSSTSPSPPSTMPPPLPPTNSTCNCGVAKRMTRIINGVSTEVNEYPWMVTLHLSSGHHCGGSILSPWHVLTAAHCVPDWRPASRYSVIVGEHDLSDSQESETETFAVAKILNHHWYKDNDPNTPRADISILTLASPITFSASAAPVCLPATESPQYTGQVATVAGWGAVDNFNTWNTSGTGGPGDGDYPDILQEVQLTVVSNTECDAAYVAYGYNGVDR